MFIRKLLFHLLGFQAYLRLISLVFLQTYRWGLFLPAHSQVRFLASLLKPGDVCVDIGANLGYFSVPISRLIGKSGKLYAVEPVPAFREVLLRNLARFALQNVEVMPYALGEDDHKVISLATPEVAGVVRHGRTEVVEVQDKQPKNTAFSHEATMMRPQTLFAQLTRLNYIKCDVEGYELHIMPQFAELLTRHKPILEIELGTGENQEQMRRFLAPLGYQAFVLQAGKLQAYAPENARHRAEIEWYFFHESALPSSPVLARS